MLAGRDTEQARLTALLDGARRSSSGVLVLRGEAGAGKSVLLAHAAESAPDMTVLEVSGVEAEAELPYAALHRLLRQLLNRLDVIPRHQADALRVALGVQPGPAPDRFLVSLAVLSLLDEVSAERPVLCVIDDAHWLDTASAHALAFVARRLAAEPVAMLFGVREPLPAPAVADLPVLHVGALGLAPASALLGRRAGVDVHPDVAVRLVTATAGNPLALAELADALTADQLTGRGPLPDPLPLTAGVEQSFLRRARALPPATQQALLVAATDDTRSLPVVVAAAGRLGLDAAALDVAEHDGIVRTAGTTIDFRHPLVRSAIYRGATAHERRTVHGALAAVLDESGDPDRTAWHRAAAATEPDAAVAGQLAAAADRADGRGAFAAAATALHRSAELTADPPLRARRLMSAAERWWRAAQPDRAQLLLDQARAAAAGTALSADIDFLHGMAQLAQGSSTSAYRTVRRAAEALAASDPSRTLALLAFAAEAASNANDAEAVVSLGAQADNLDVDDPRGRFLRDILVGTAHHFDRRPADAVTPLSRAMAAAGDFTDAMSLMIAGRAAFYLGDDDAGHRFSAAAVSAAQAGGDVGVIPIAGARVALADLLAGRWQAALAAATEAVELSGTIGQPGLSGHGLCSLALHAALRGDADGLRRHADAALAVTAGRPMGFLEDWVRWILGAADLGREDPAGANGRFDPIRHPVVLVLSSFDRLEAAHWAGHRDAADRMVTDLQVYAAACPHPWVAARAAHGRGLLGDGADAERAYAEALDHHRRANRPFERARTELAFGAALRRARRRAAARGHLREAFNAFDGLGAAEWAERAQRELRACGQSVRPRAEASFDQLTPQEVQVAGLVAQGLSNADVAARLFLSRRTIDFHLRNVFAKLGITSRTELASMLVTPS